MAITYFGSGIWSYRRLTRGAILWVTVPATIIKSLWRGEARNTPAPNRSKSYLVAAVAIISMAQQARPNAIGHRALRRPQSLTQSTLVRITDP